MIAGTQHDFEAIDKHVGQQFYTLRTLRGLTLKDIGAALGKSYQQVAKYERGENRMSASVMLILAQTLDCNITDFYRGLDGLPDDVSDDEPNIGAMGNDVIKAAGALASIQDEKVKGTLVKLIKQMSKQHS